MADRVFGDLGHRTTLARLPPPRPARSRRRLSKARPSVRRHQAVTCGRRREVIRVLSGAVLILFAVGVVWFAPPIVFRTVAFGLLLMGVVELVGLARASGLDVPLWLSATAALVTLAAFALAPDTDNRHATPLSIVLMVQAVAISAAAMGRWAAADKDALATGSAARRSSLYL